jgi:RNA polymerase sigma factor (sigma-70 family)
MATGAGPQGDELSWLFLIARRLVVDRHRRQFVKWLPLLANDQVHDIPSPYSETETAVWFEQIRSALPPRQYEALMLRYLLDFDDDHIGHLMGIGRGGVRTNVARALTTLRKNPEVLL